MQMRTHALGQAVSVRKQVVMCRYGLVAWFRAQNNLGIRTMGEERCDLRLIAVWLAKWMEFGILGCDASPRMSRVQVATGSRLLYVRAASHTAQVGLGKEDTPKVTTERTTRYRGNLAHASFCCHGRREPKFKGMLW